MFPRNFSRSLVLAFLAFLLGATPLLALEFTLSCPGDFWPADGVAGQNFSPSVEPNPDPGLQLTDTVYLVSFTFISTGQGIGRPDTRLVILDGAYPELTGLTLSSPTVLGISTNSFDTAAAALNDVLAFQFDYLPLTYGNYYTAAFTQVGEGGALSFFLVGAMISPWVEVEPGVWQPSPNYGGGPDVNPTYWNTSALWYDGSSAWFNGFSYGGDTNFTALLVTSPPPPPLLGDTNGDGVVDLADYNNVVNNLGASGSGQLGDTNDDEVVDLADYNNVVNNLGATQQPSSLAVPEPLAGLLLLPALALVVRRS